MAILWPLIGAVAGGAAAGGVGGLMNQQNQESAPGWVDYYGKKMASGNYALQQNQLSQQRTVRDWMQYYYPQMKGLNEQLMPLIQQRLQQPGLPKELEQQVWQLAQQRLAKGYSGAENQLGNIMSSRGMLQSGPAMQSWMDKIALPRAQGEQQLGTDRAMANYSAMNDAISQALQMMGMAPNVQGGAGAGMQYPPQQQQQEPVDYSSLGTLFAKGMGGMFGGTSPGTKPTAQQYNVNV